MRLVDTDVIEKELGVEDRDLYVQHILDSAPTVEAEPIKHGHWIRTGKERPGAPESIRCSECGFWYIKLTPRFYCSNCGAKMDGEEK